MVAKDIHDTASHDTASHDTAVYDTAILGGGEAGAPLACHLATAGLRAVLVEGQREGLVSCGSTKAALASARLAYEARRAAAFGVVIPEVTIDFGAVLVRAKRIARRYEREHRRVQASCNIERLWGRPRFEGKVGKYFMVQAGNRLIKAERVVISTGSRPRLPPLAGLESLDYLHTGNCYRRRLQRRRDEPVLPPHGRSGHPLAAR
jgi:pyruvate/2-oxoglutarate dehydrogenase complex dihydrolipoamide dehydrogenase (E3) component